MKITSANTLSRILLQLMAFHFNHRSKLNQYLKSTQGWINFSIGFKTEDNSVEQSIHFHNGKVRVQSSLPDNLDALMVFSNEDTIKEMLKITPEEVLNLLLKNKLCIKGNISYIQLFNFYISLLLGKKHQKMREKQIKQQSSHTNTNIAFSQSLNQENKGIAKQRKQRIKAKASDPGVQFLEDPYLSEYSIEDFPRLKDFLHIHFNEKPEICAERPKLLTDFFLQHGFEEKTDGSSWVPELRQAEAFKYLMENKKPIIRKNDLIGGTTTSKEIGVVIYPDGAGTLIWGELLSVPHRQLNPYHISKETIDILHHHVFPYWVQRNFREWVRHKYHSPLCQELDERFAVYFLWKTVALSHTILDFPKLLKLGTKGIIKEIQDRLANKNLSIDQVHSLSAMKICLEGLNVYAKNLSLQAAKEAQEETDSQRRTELIRLSQIFASCPENPAMTLDEAINVIWIGWLALHQENTNAGLSLGRMDQWLQPYFIADIKRISEEQEQKKYIEKAIERVGCFYMRCTDHLPLVPDIGNYLFGGSSSDQAITLGGVTPLGEDAVNDMTYIFLKVTELLGIRDPNVNARFKPGINSDTYLKRLCEVNLITTATPSMHNDDMVIESLAEFNYDIADLRNWAATGCVEPTLSGKHMGHTNCMMMNMVAALEMALNNGKHPLMRWEVGPKTGDISNGGFNSFSDLFNAFKTQYQFLIEQSIDYNNKLGEAHSILRPTPLLSSLIDDCIKKGKDATKGGAKYNSSGAACIGLADIIDSLLVIKKLIYDENQVSLVELKQALDDNFESNPVLHTMILNKMHFFGSGDEESLSLANEITRFTHDTYKKHTNFRGGPYTAGFWSMSNHVAFGTLSGALPSGRLAGKAFTPGLTPSPYASNNLLDNIRDVAKLDPHYMNNNIAFNVKIVPSTRDSHSEIVDHMFFYVKTYFELGGMQIQLNVVTSDILRDAMLHPDQYQNLLVRISGYNAYFVTLNKDMQMELIERAEYGV